MTKSMGDNVLWDIQGSSNRRPGMASHIGRQHREGRTEHLHFTIHAQIIGAPFLHDRTNSLQATAHLHGKGGIAFSVFPPGDKPTTGAVILLDESSSLWLHLDIIEPPRFGATIGQATIDKLPIFQSQQVNQVNANQTERELEGIDILLLPGQTREREQRAKSLHRHSSFFVASDFTLKERNGYQEVIPLSMASLKTARTFRRWMERAFTEGHPPCSVPSHASNLDSQSFVMRSKERDSA